MDNFPELLTEQEAALALRVSVAKLQRDRWAGSGVPYIKLGRAVRYSKQTLLNHCEAQTRNSTSDDGGRA